MPKCLLEGADGGVTAISVVEIVIMVCGCPKSVLMLHLQQQIPCYTLIQQGLLEQYSGLMMPPRAPMLVTVLR